MFKLLSFACYKQTFDKNTNFLEIFKNHLFFHFFGAFFYYVLYLFR
jgi:hypothetical protein